MKVATKWLKGCDSDKEVSEVKAKISSAIPAFKMLKEMLQEEVENLRRKARSEESYNSPNWAHLQADCIGEERALLRVVSLLSVKNEEE